jgi:hypothetical protein
MPNIEGHIVQCNLKKWLFHPHYIFSAGIVHEAIYYTRKIQGLPGKGERDINITPESQRLLQMHQTC